MFTDPAAHLLLLERALVLSQLEATEDRLAIGELRIVRVRACLERQQATGQDIRSNETILQTLQHLQEQRRCRRHVLLVQLGQLDQATDQAKSFHQSCVARL